VVPYDEFPLSLNTQGSTRAETGFNFSVVSQFEFPGPNYVKQHKTLKGLSPAMAAGLSDPLLNDRSCRND
jgi:hypothetical protein